MKISEKRLRQIIKEESRRALFEKDEERIKSKISARASKLGPGGNSVTPLGSQSGDAQDYNTRDVDPNIISNEKELKRIWAEEVNAEKSRSFFDNEVIKVHFVNSLWMSGRSNPNTPGVVSGGLSGAVKFVKNNLSKNRDEISCLGYLPGDSVVGTVAPKIGIIIKGWTTYASANDAATHMTSMASAELRAKKRGLHKRPASRSVNVGASEMMTDKESFMSRSKDYHEIIVDNWLPAGIVINSEYFRKEADTFKAGLSKFTKGMFTNGIPQEIKDKFEKRQNEINELLALKTDVFNENFVKYDKIPNPFVINASSLSDEWELLFKAGAAIPSGCQFISDPGPGIVESRIENKTLKSASFVDISKNLSFSSCQLDNCFFKDTRSLALTFYKSKFNNVSVPLVRECAESTFQFIDCDLTNCESLIREVNSAKSFVFSNCKLNDFIAKQFATFEGLINISNCGDFEAEIAKWRDAMRLPPRAPRSAPPTRPLPPLPPPLTQPLPPLPPPLSELRMLRRLIKDYL